MRGRIRAERGGLRRGFRIDQVSERMHFVQTPFVNWAIYVGSDGVTLIDSGYQAQRGMLIASLSAVGCRPEDVSAVLITHGHADHIGGAARLAQDLGTAVHAHENEVENVQRTMEQAGPIDVLSCIGRPGVMRWSFAILPLTRFNPRRGVPSASQLPIDADRVAVPGRPSFMQIAGHTSGHAVFDFEDEGVIVVGDALATGHPISPIVGPQLLPSVFHHNARQARASLERIRASAAGVMLPGHGDAWIGSAPAAVERALAAGAPW